MDNSNTQSPNAGSFMGNAGGGGQAILEALQRRGVSVPGGPNQSTLPNSGAVLPSAPPPISQGGLPPQQTPPPSAQPSAPPPPMPSPNPMVDSSALPPGATPSGQMMQPPGQMGDPETQLILQAMADMLESKSQIQEAQAGVPITQAHGALLKAQAQQSQPVGGE